jgi:lipopolysaccharide biosynthesis regulator YciM
MTKIKAFMFFFTIILWSSHQLIAQSDALGYEYYRKGEFSKAAKEFSKLYKKDANTANYEYLLKCYLKSNNYSKAEKTVKKHLKKTRFKAPIQVDLGLVYTAWGKEKRAKENNEEIINNLQPYTEQILKVGKKFFQVKNYEYAEKSYLKGRKLTNGDYPFSFELAEVHAVNQNLNKMIAELLFVLSYGDQYMDGVKNALSTHLSNDKNGNRRKRVKNQLIKIVQKNSDQKSYLELLVWLYIEEQNYTSAFIYAKSLDKRFDEDGRRILKLARQATKNHKYEAAEQCFNYIISNKAESYYYRVARVGVVTMLKDKIDANPFRSQNDILSLEKAYKKTLNEIGKNNYSIKLIRSYAELLAFYLNKTNEAINLIKEGIALPRVNAIEKAQCQLLLGDIYVYTDDVWEAALIYGKVNHQFKNDPVGFVAKLKVAKAYYYTGNFDWAKTQLDVLKAATTKLIANDALQLSVLISDNLGMDTNTVALQMFAKADLHYYQGHNDSALFNLHQLIGSFPDHLSLLDDAYFLKANIMEKTMQWEKAIKAYSKVIEYDDLLVDDALMKLGTIYELIIKDPVKASEYYEKIILNFPASVLVVEARRRYRQLQKNI